MIRIFPRQTKWTPDDELTFIGLPPLFRPPEQPVKISVTFTWDIETGERLKSEWSSYYKDVQIGGPAFGDPGETFEPGMFVKRGVTITSRGCSKACPWCFVPKREGKIRELEIKPGHILQDNNLLACSREHIENVFAMLREQKKGISFNGGMDTMYMQKWHRKLFDSIKIKELWFACDSEQGIKPLERTAEILEGISINKRRCYALIGFGNETLSQAEKRLEKIYSLGFLPFAQLYKSVQQKNFSKEWKALGRKWSRPAAYRKVS